MKMAALVEDARWRTSARGNRYLLATLSDQSGQFMASSFDEVASNAREAAGRSGACLLLTVEIDRRPGEETPRVTVRSCQPLEGLGLNTRLVLEVETGDPEALPALAALVRGEGGGRGEIRLRALLADGSHADLLLGRGFLLDAELVAQIERLPGVTARLRPADAPKLALVS
jgi:DNA polymerase-3 subunit alpha